MEFLAIQTLDDAKAWLREQKVVSCEALHVIALVIGEENREALEEYADTLDFELVGEPGI